MKTDLMQMRCFRNWSNEQIIEILESENRPSDLVVFKKFLKSGWKKLQGSNVCFTDGSEKSKQLNAENELHACWKLHQEFGRLNVDMHFLPRDLFEDVVKLDKETNGACWEKDWEEAR